MRLTVRLTRARAPEAGEGASQSLQGLELETVEQPNRNFREIQRGGTPEKFSSRGNAIRGIGGRSPYKLQVIYTCPACEECFSGLAGE